MNWQPPGFQPPGWQPPEWQPGFGEEDQGGGGGMQPVNGRKPRTRKVSLRSVSFALAGPEQPYPVYQFSNRVFIERPKHNPFDGL